eukprot:SAG11_NODE_1970_length_3983_cov_2.766478_1_plen_198_part_00
MTAGLKQLSMMQLLVTTITLAAGVAAALLLVLWKCRPTQQSGATFTWFWFFHVAPLLRCRCTLWSASSAAAAAAARRRAIFAAHEQVEPIRVLEFPLWPAHWPFCDADFAPSDGAPDRKFYAHEGFEDHVDAAASAALARFCASRLHPPIVAPRSTELLLHQMRVQIPRWRRCNRRRSRARRTYSMSRRPLQATIRG